MRKTTGTDRLSADFYKFTIGQKRGIITLLPKKNKDRRFLKKIGGLSLFSTPIIKL